MNAVPQTEVLRLGVVAVDVEGVGVGEGSGSRFAAAFITNTGLPAGIVPPLVCASFSV